VLKVLCPDRNITGDASLWHLEVCSADKNEVADTEYR